MTDRETVEMRLRSWIEGYVRAWESNEPADVRALFVEDGEYRTEPWAPATVGVSAIVEQWLGRRDDPGSWEFEWDVAGIDGARGFVTGTTRYADGRVYDNLWVIDLADDGPATSFTEWWMDRSQPS